MNIRNSIGLSKNEILILSLSLIVLSIISSYNYLLFHTFAELFSIIIAFCFFLIVWNSRHIIGDNFLLLLGIAYFFIGSIDLIHALSYKGMNLFMGYDSNLPTQLWIAARYMESLSVLIAAMLIGKKYDLKYIFSGYAVIFSFIMLSIFYFEIFPACFVEGEGLTQFKVFSEYLICLIYAVGIYVLYKNRDQINGTVYKYLIAAIGFSIITEFSFTLFSDPYGFFNLFGHLFKIISFFFIYKAIVVSSISDPFHVFFTDLKREKDKAQHYLDIAGVLFLALDKEQNISLVNKKATELLGYSEEELLGVNWFDRFVPENERSAVKGVYEQLMTGDIVPVEYYDNSIITKTGDEKIIFWHNSVIKNKNNEIDGIFSSGLDVTHKRNSEKELLKAKFEAEAANNAKSSFLANMSHEIRTPLNSIIGFSDILCSNDQGSLNVKQKGYLSNVSMAGKHLLELINGILDLSKIEAGKMELNCVEFPINLIFNEVKSVLIPLSAKNNIEVKFINEGVEFINADRFKLKQIFYNLASNSIKFSDPGDEIIIRVKEIEGASQFSVEDNGCGISEEILSSIFEPFVQDMHSLSRNQQGTGLGLAIVKRFVEFHGGIIYAESKLGEGSKFIFTIPHDCGEI